MSMQEKYDVLCAGIAAVNFPIMPVDEGIFARDLTQVRPMELLPGGDAVNQAIVLSRLGFRPVLSARCGGDMFGRMLRDLIEKYGDGVSFEGLTCTGDVATSVGAMLIRPDGQRHFCSHRSATNAFCYQDIPGELVRRARIVSIGGLMALPSFDGEGSARLFCEAKAAGAVTVADTKFDLKGIGLAGIRETLRYTDYFFPSYDEAKAIAGKEEPEAMAEVFLQAGARHVGIKLGEKGCYAHDGRKAFSLPALESTVVDTTGAGDHFMAGFIAGLLQNKPMEDCAALGTACGALCVATVGPCTAVNSMAQVEALMKGAVQ